jgi:hypothetical protein
MKFHFKDYDILISIIKQIVLIQFKTTNITLQF